MKYNKTELNSNIKANKIFRAIGHVSWLKITEFSVTIFNKVTWLIVREDFIYFSSHESFRSYIKSIY
jgi:hypothetical protein